MKQSHKKIIALVTKDAIPFVINQGVSIMNSAVQGEKEILSKDQIGHIEKLIKKVNKESGQSLTLKVKNIEDIGISKEELGRRTWDKIHNEVGALPKDADPTQVKEKMDNIQSMINEYPCIDCRKNAKENLKERADRGFSIDSVKTKTDAVKWAYDFHNLVNEDLKKDKYPIQELKQNYDF